MTGIWWTRLVVTSWQLGLFKFSELSGFWCQDFSRSNTSVTEKSGFDFRDQTLLVAFLKEFAKFGFCRKDVFVFLKLKHCTNLNLSVNTMIAEINSVVTEKIDFDQRDERVFASNYCCFGLSIFWFTEQKDWYSHRKLLFKRICFDWIFDERCQNSSYGELRVR